MFSRVTGASKEELEALVEYKLSKIGAGVIEMNWMDVFSKQVGNLRLKILNYCT